jgi:hypothetical protein
MEAAIHEAVTAKAAAAMKAGAAMKAADPARIAEAGPVEPTTATAKAAADNTRRIEVLIELRMAISFSRAAPGLSPFSIDVNTRAGVYSARLTQV